MALDIKTLDRKFVVTINNESVTLTDPNPDFSPDEVMGFYSNTYPELTNSTVQGPVMSDEGAVYTFKTTVGQKG